MKSDNGNLTLSFITGLLKKFMLYVFVKQIQPWVVNFIIKLNISVIMFSTHSYNFPKLLLLYLAADVLTFFLSS